MHWLTSTPHSIQLWACAMAALPRRLGAAPAGAATNASEATFRSAKLPENKICRPLDFPKNANWTQICWVNVTSSIFSPIQVFRDSTIIPQNSFLKHILSHFSIQPLTCKSNGSLAKGMPVAKPLELLRQRLSTIQTCSCTGQGQVRWPLHCFKSNLEIARHTAQNCKGWK